ncbi:MAG TPA: hypothetical protein VF980_08735 [Thermoanaerobaculia bacterium]
MQLRTTSNLCAVIIVFATACTSDRLIRRVQDFRAANDRGDLVTAQSYLAPDARQWFESRSGEGEPYKVGGVSRWSHWDEYFHSRNSLTNWRVEGNAVIADVEETNDFMRMLDWHAKPYTMTWWLDDRSRITGVLVKSNPEAPVSRLEEFKQWAREHHPEELAYLLPKNRIDPTGDRPERWRAILREWRNASGRPTVE